MHGRLCRRLRRPPASSFMLKHLRLAFRFAFVPRLRERLAFLFRPFASPINSLVCLPRFVLVAPIGLADGMLSENSKLKFIGSVLDLQINKQRPQCQSIDANANAKAQCNRTCEAAAPLESCSSPAGSSPALLAVLLLLSVGDAVEETGAEAVEETGAEAVEETEAEAVLLLLDCAGAHVPLTKE